ncbi:MULTISPECIES: type I-F CRISPR-associated endoribonuclease Cas6/Csy4 [Chromobacterium]|uniref:Type I-F CRISPR-associated endoribonuclease Cas6/Csy4 n=1 Tax=Chromobacterium rhizoryzae TaxID=1778675 RepID=A0AAD0WAJ6_9NEIS|nr:MULTISPECIES: type I-F CRISPR-associated endoribonuclease Cas6/Csy4 [Chromobacterium]AXT48023.1 type I-F CRISPR-associated endoribonuclease Cas6/Csy4 [Chromobacterium rhizoryzae]PTU71630.1 type I-F CRISPR-associated endoribonuclease Cas6/Csy4 [Chromobacterium haemolyticum]
MDHYLDIRLRPDPEFAPTLLMNALFAKLHRALSEQGRDDIGVSFPRAAPAAALGDTLRLHGGHAALQRLMAGDWLSGMRDHIALAAIQPVPPQAEAWQVRRKQAKTNPDKERRRLVRRLGISAEEAAQRFPDSAARRLTLPFLTLNSASTGQRYQLHIEQRPAPATRSGRFNTFGLSPDATVPWF